MNKPYFTESYFHIITSGHPHDICRNAAYLANQKIQPLLKKLERYEKALKLVIQNDTACYNVLPVGGTPTTIARTALEGGE